MTYGLYYQAYVHRERAWILTAILRSAEHLAFDRTLDVAQGLFEFFVPPAMESSFLEIMAFLEHEDIVHSLCKLPNRLIDEELPSACKPRKAN